MAPVHTFNGEPVDWHTLRVIETPSDTYELCRCGKSKNKPFCDSSHLTARWDGTQTAPMNSFRERSTRARKGDETLADDQPLCIFAGFCGTRTRNVWDMFLESDDPEERQLMRDMVWRCPSGRIALVGPDGFGTEPDLPQSIAILPGGPIWVRGGIPILAENGQPWEPRNRVTVCRCGRSKNKPYCDGTHQRIHFDER